MNRLRILSCLTLLTITLSGCGQAPEQPSKLPDFGTDTTDSARLLDQRLRGRLDLPVLSGIFTLRPDRSVLEVQRLQVSGTHDAVHLFCSTDVASESWWSSRVDTSKESWQMRMRAGRDLEVERAARVAGNPGCMVEATGLLATDVYMPLTPVEAQPLVYKGATGKASYTLTLPASANLAGAHLQATAKGAGKLTCQQVIGDVAGGAVAGGSEPAIPKFPNAAALRTWKAAHPMPQGALLGVSASPGDALVDDPTREGTKTIHVYGIVGQSTSREVARLGGLWCGRYQGGKGYSARFTQLAQLHKVNVTVAKPADLDPEAQRVAAALMATGAIGVTTITDQSVIAKAYPKLDPQPTNVVITDDTRTQALSAQLLVYSDLAEATAVLRPLRTSVLRGLQLSTACTTVIEAGPSSPAQQARAHAQLVQLSKQLVAGCPKPATG
jgi:hypothetical protein